MDERTVNADKTGGVPYTPSPDLSLWQTAAVALVEYACGGAHGRGKDEDAYREVTEGRDVGMLRAHYSSCGDLAHWLLARLGLDEPWVNRQSLGHYRIGANISDLASSPAAHTPSGVDWSPEPGDIIVIWNAPAGQDAHACVALAAPESGKLRTGNYGAGGMSAAAWPGANISSPALVYSNLHWVLGHRRVQRVIRLVDAVRLAKRPPDLTGAALPGEVIDALQAKWSPA